MFDIILKRRHTHTNMHWRLSKWIPWPHARHLRDCPHCIQKFMKYWAQHDWHWTQHSSSSWWTAPRLTNQTLQGRMSLQKHLQEMSSSLCKAFGQANRLKSVWTHLTRRSLLQNVSTRQPVESQESSWLKGKLREGRARCQSACGNVSRSICWLVPTGQKANICFAETNASI